MADLLQQEKGELASAVLLSCISSDLWMAFCWMAAWSHSLELNVNHECREKNASQQFQISSTTQPAPLPVNFFFDVNISAYDDIRMFHNSFSSIWYVQY